MFALMLPFCYPRSIPTRQQLVLTNVPCLVESQGNGECADQVGVRLGAICHADEDGVNDDASLLQRAHATLS